MVFCAEHPKPDQNPKFTPLSETMSKTRQDKTMLYLESYTA